MDLGCGSSHTRRVLVSLPIRNLEELKARVDNRDRISIDDYQTRYFPLVSDYHEVADWLIDQGLKLDPEDPSHILLSVSGTVSQISAAFRTTFAIVTTAEGEFTSAISEPSVPSNLAYLIQGIHGLQPHLSFHTHVIPCTPTGNPTPLKTAYPLKGIPNGCATNLIIGTL